MTYLISYIVIGLLFTLYRDFFVTHYTKETGLDIIKDFLMLCANLVVCVIGWPVLIIVCYRDDRKWEKDKIKLFRGERE